MSDLICPRLTPLEVVSRNLRFPKDEDAKPRKIRYVFVALELRYSNLEMLLRVMQKIASYVRLSGSVFFVSWSECSHYTNSGALLTNYSTSGDSGIARNSRQKRAPECPRGIQSEKKKQDKRR